MNRLWKFSEDAKKEMGNRATREPLACWTTPFFSIHIRFLFHTRIHLSGNLWDVVQSVGASVQLSPGICISVNERVLRRDFREP